MLVALDVCHRAVACRDARFDGRFVVAAAAPGRRSRRRAGESTEAPLRARPGDRSRGGRASWAELYCRPSCAARPLRRAVRFFPCAASAEAAGLRPCPGCRPEAAPGWPIWTGPGGTVSRALRLIDDGALDRGDAASLAAQLGVDERDLRDEFERQLGASPLAVASSRRAHLARALLEATDLPMTGVARAAGLGGARQLDSALRAAFGRTAGQLRAERPAPVAGRAAGVAGDGIQPRVAGRAAGVARDAIQLQVGFRPPLAWQALLEFLATRAIPGVEAVDLERGLYRRTCRAGAAGGVVTAARGVGDTIQVTVSGSAAAIPEVVRRVRRLFDLDADPLAVAGRLGASGRLRSVLAACPGLRVPGAWEPFEVLVRAILGQQISVAAARTLAGRLVERCGEPIAAPDGELVRVFPLPAAVAAADVAAIGLPSARARSLRESAAAVARDPGLLAPAGGHEALVARLRGLPGVGPWTAEYVAMRMGEPDAFPAGDLGLRRAVGARRDGRGSGSRPAGGGDASERELGAVAEAWRPWRAYAAVALWRSLGSAPPRRPATREPAPRASLADRGARPAVGVGPSGVGLGKEPKKRRTALEGGAP